MATKEPTSHDLNDSAIPDPGSGIYKGSAEKVEELKPMLLALPYVRAFRLYVPWALSAGIRNWESYTQDKARFTESFTLEGFNPALVEDFPTRVGVLWYLHAALGQLAEATGLAPELLAKARSLHGALSKTARYLFEDHAILGRIVQDIRRGTGHLEMADDMIRYAILFDQQWDQIQGRCAITRQDIDAAHRIGVEILTVITDSQQTEADVIKDLRNRAAEYLLQGAQQIQRAAFYLFDDSPSVARRYPSLHRNQIRARRRNPQDSIDETELPEVPELELLDEPPEPAEA